MHLPLEIINEIVLVLATPVHPLQYGYDDQTLSALYRLSLCNRTTFELTIPHIYRSIRILRDRQFIHLHVLLRTRQDLANLVESVYIHSHSEHLNRIESLARFFTILAPSLRRLFIERDTSRPEWEYLPLCQALMKCQSLEEFCTLKTFESYLWSSHANGMHWRGRWPKLKRLLAHDSEVSLNRKTIDLIRQHPPIATVIIPVSNWTVLARALPSTERVAGRIKNIPLDPYVAFWLGYSETAKRILGWKDREEAAADESCFQMLGLSAYKFGLLDFVRSRTLDGCIWNLMDDFVK
ncbi:hypothetical protein AX16_007025 [Volvariella volvacea WC 439]|nr:hypothetical protein AX16_007025 [Volvariella volvacea WC 439]